MRKFFALAIAFACLSTSIFAQTPTELLEKAKKAVKAASESVASSNSNNQTSTLGDNNDILAELKAKMEKGGK